MRYGGESAARAMRSQRKTKSGHIEHQTSYTQTCFLGGWWFDANLYVLKYCQKKNIRKPAPTSLPPKIAPFSVVATGPANDVLCENGNAGTAVKKMVDDLGGCCIIRCEMERYQLLALR